MAENGLWLALEFRDDALSQHFTQLHTPLVERVDVPDNALGEDCMLIQGDELAERFRREPFGKERIRRAVALEDAMRHEPIRRALGFYFLRCLAEGQRFGLGEDVCQEHVVVPTQRVERLVERDEVAGNESRSLMNQLIEGMLPIGSRLAPIDRAGIVADSVALEGDVFAVALHRQLLQIGWESLEVLLVRQYRDSLGAEEVGMPHRR